MPTHACDVPCLALARPLLASKPAVATSSAGIEVPARRRGRVLKGFGVLARSITGPTHIWLRVCASRVFRLSKREPSLHGLLSQALAPSRIRTDNSAPSLYTACYMAAKAAAEAADMQAKTLPSKPMASTSPLLRQQIPSPRARRRRSSAQLPHRLSASERMLWI